MPIEPKKKVAVVHDWLVSYRGGERVLEAILELFPDADIFTLIHCRGSVGEKIEKHKIYTSFLNNFPGVRKYYRHLLPLMPLAVENWDFREYDLVISCNSCVAKGIIPGPNTCHIAYMFTTMRYAWDQYPNYFGKSWLHPFIFPWMHYLRIWDVASSARVDTFIADSEFVGRRIEKYYRRNSKVIYPFVSLEKFPLWEGPREEYYLIAGAQAPYKKVDLAIEACKKIGRKCIVVGSGQNLKSNRKLKSEQIEFAGQVSDSELCTLYQKARALLFPGEEDFGIVPLEAMACGTPVIAFGAGGALETIVDNKTGSFFSPQTVHALAEKILAFEKMSFSALSCRQQAEKFSKENFLQQMQSVISP